MQTKPWTWECAGCGKQTSVTAGTIMHHSKLPLKHAHPDRSPLAGLVEVDETEIACRSKHDPLTGGGGRSHQGKMLIVGAVEVQDGGAGPGRIRLAEVADYSTSKEPRACSCRAEMPFEWVAIR